MTRLAELRALAERATRNASPADAMIAATRLGAMASPDVVLALVQTIEELRGALVRFEGERVDAALAACDERWGTP